MKKKYFITGFIASIVFTLSIFAFSYTFFDCYEKWIKIPTLVIEGVFITVSLSLALYACTEYFKK